jgi:hypothetical protein
MAGCPGTPDFQVVFFAAISGFNIQSFTDILLDHLNEEFHARVYVIFSATGTCKTRVAYYRVVGVLFSHGASSNKKGPGAPYWNSLGHPGPLFTSQAPTIQRLPSGNHGRGRRTLAHSVSISSIFLSEKSLMSSVSGNHSHYNRYVFCIAYTKNPH